MTTSTPKSRKRWILPLLRYGLCAVAIAYLVTHVPWHDYVFLDDANQTRVRLLEERDDGCRVRVDGRETFVPEAGLLHVVDQSGASVRKVEYGIAGVVPRIDRRQALWGILIFLPVSLIQSLRLVWMLAVQDVKLSYWNAVKLTYAGNFFNFALPGTTGGDLIKAYYITRFTHRKTEAVTTVFLDRVIGLLGLVLLAGAMILVASDRQRFGQVGLILAIVTVGLAIGTVLVVSRRLRHAIGLPALAARLPAGDQLLRIGRAVVAMRHHKALVAASLLNTVVLQFIVMVSAYVMALAIGMKDDFVKYLIYVPIGFLIAAIPIAPPQGFGVMEAAYIQFFARGGLATVSQAFMFALAVRVIQLVWALPGVLVPLVGAHLPRPSELRALGAEAEPPRPSVEGGPQRAVLTSNRSVAPASSAVPAPQNRATAAAPASNDRAR